MSLLPKNDAEWFASQQAIANTRNGVQIVTGNATQDAFLRVADLERENAKLREEVEMLRAEAGEKPDPTRHSICHACGGRGFIDR